MKGNKLMYLFLPKQIFIHTTQIQYVLDSIAVWYLLKVMSAMVGISCMNMQHNQQHHRKVLLNGFHLNGHTLGFHPQNQKLESPCTA